MLWVLAGLALAAWSVWGLATEGYDASDITSWLIPLGFAVLALASGYLFGRAGVLGRVMIRFVSIVSLFYACAWLFLGGVEDAGIYVVAIAPLVCLSVYGLIIAAVEANAA